MFGPGRTITLAQSMEDANGDRFINIVLPANHIAKKDLRRVAGEAAEALDQLISNYYKQGEPNNG